jgi:hypothetical protein
MIKDQDIYDNINFNSNGSYREGDGMNNYYDIEKQNASGMILGACILAAGIIILIGIFCR